MLGYIYAYGNYEFVYNYYMVYWNIVLFEKMYKKWNMVIGIKLVGYESGYQDNNSNIR